MELKDLKNIPFTLAMLSAIYPKINNISGKAIELEKKGKIIRLKRGLYVVSPQTNGIMLSEGLIANHLYGPSYVSMETALRYYGLIPERVMAVRSMTIKHTRGFATPLGLFEYIRCNEDYFKIGIMMEQDYDTSFLIATPEKALCDLLMTTPTTDIRFRHELLAFLEDNLRFDMDAFHSMRIGIFKECLYVSKKKSLINNLIKLI